MRPGCRSTSGTRSSSLSSRPCSAKKKSRETNQSPSFSCQIISTRWISTSPVISVLRLVMLPNATEPITVIGSISISIERHTSRTSMNNRVIASWPIWAGSSRPSMIASGR